VLWLCHICSKDMHACCTDALLLLLPLVCWHCCLQAEQSIEASLLFEAEMVFTTLSSTQVTRKTRKGIGPHGSWMRLCEWLFEAEMVFTTLSSTQAGRHGQDGLGRPACCSCPHAHAYDPREGGSVHLPFGRAVS